MLRRSEQSRSGRWRRQVSDSSTHRQSRVHSERSSKPNGVWNALYESSADSRQAQVRINRPRTTYITTVRQRPATATLPAGLSSTWSLFARHTTPTSEDLVRVRCESRDPKRGTTTRSSRHGSRSSKRQQMGDPASTDRKSRRTGKKSPPAQTDTEAPSERATNSSRQRRYFDPGLPGSTEELGLTLGPNINDDSRDGLFTSSTRGGSERDTVSSEMGRAPRPKASRSRDPAQQTTSDRTDLHRLNPNKEYVSTSHRRSTRTRSPRRTSGRAPRRAKRSETHPQSQISILCCFM